MEKSTESYHISFFKPTTKRARFNRNLVIWLVLIWFIAIYGFQIVLKIIEKPAPEPQLTTFQNAWNNIDEGQHDMTDLQDLAGSCLSIAGRMDLSGEEKASIDQAFSWSVYQLHTDTERANLVQEIRHYEEYNAGITSIEDEEYQRLKASFIAYLTPVLGLSEYDVRKTLIPVTLKSDGIEGLGEETLINLPLVMTKYLTHNRSFLTDSKFLGFPFHYFYTAVFLLILFVGLCLVYCIRIDALNGKLDIVD